MQVKVVIEINGIGSEIDIHAFVNKVITYIVHGRKLPSQREGRGRGR
jgi:hypothetical protein